MASVPEVTAPKYIAPSPTAPDLTIEPVQNPVSVVEPENTQWGSPDGKDNTAQVAPVSYSIEEYQRDIPQEGEGDIESTADNPKQEAFDFPVYDIDIALWHKDPDAKSTFENFQVPNDLDSRNFIRFDESALSVLAVGQRITLPELGEQSTPVIVRDIQQWRREATNWELNDEEGNPAGSITQIGDTVEAQFFADGKTYYMRTVNGVGWLAAEETLISTLDAEFLHTGEE